MHEYYKTALQAIGKKKADELVKYIIKYAKVNEKAAQQLVGDIALQYIAFFEADYPIAEQSAKDVVIAWDTLGQYVYSKESLSLLATATLSEVSTDEVAEGIANIVGNVEKRSDCYTRITELLQPLVTTGIFNDIKTAINVMFKGLLVFTNIEVEFMF